MTDDISNALHRAADLLPDRPDRLAEVRRKRASVVRRRATAALGVLAVAGAGTAFALARGGGAGDTSVIVPGTDAAELTATGRVVQVPGKPARFCAPLGSDLMLVTPPPPPAWCEWGIDVRGVDFAAVANRYEKAGAVEGNATLTGRLDGDVLVVTKQDQPRVEPEPAFNVDPAGCAPPAGGWPDTGRDANVDMDAAQAYQKAHPDQVAEVAIARPSATQAVRYVLTWIDPAVVKAALADTYGDDLCVLQSRWSREEYSAAAEELTGTADPLRTFGIYVLTSKQMRNDGDVYVEADAIRSTARLDAIVARHPAGLITIRYWLRPVS